MTGMTVPDTMPAGTMTGTPQVLLAHHLKHLKLPTVLREYNKVARECARDGVDHPRYLLRLIELELIDRERRTVERRIRAARFPAVKSFDAFDFATIPGLNKMLVLELARCEYILRRENIIALGNSGKTHVALALGLAACQKGFAVAFTTATALVSQLLEARGRSAATEAPTRPGVGQAANHRRTRLRPAVAHRCRAVVRDLLPALRARVHHCHVQPAVRGLDVGAGVGAAYRRAPGQADPPRQHLTINGDSYRLKESAGRRRATAIDPETGEITQG